MIVKFKKLHEEAELPEYKSDGASGFDLIAIEDVMVNAFETAIVPTGLAVELFKVGPVFYEIQVRPRSGITLKTPIEIPNSPGTIDIDYRGEIGVIVKNVGDRPYMIKKGTRIAQGVIAPCMRCDLIWVDELSDTVRGTGGFGHTGDGVS